jgi:hypothetical protein
VCLGGLFVSAFAPPRLGVAADASPDEVVLTARGSVYRVESGLAEPGNQYPPVPHESAVSPAVAPPVAATVAAPAPRLDEWRASVDVGAVADSNFTNGPHSDTVAIDLGDGPLPMPLDPNLQAKSGVGAAFAATGNARLPIARDLVLAADLEAYAVDQQGGASDDLSALAALGLEFGPAGAADGSVQLIVFDRSYGGTSVGRGWGLRGTSREGLGPGRTLRLAVDARIFNSGYGERFDGKTVSLYATLDMVVLPTLSASFGLYGRREWLRDDAFSNLDAGAYLGLSAFLGDNLAGGGTVGLSHTSFDRAYLLLSPAPRRDWRGYGSLWLATRRPVVLGIVPSLTYTYTRTSSSSGYYDSDRHRVRLGMQRKF